MIHFAIRSSKDTMIYWLWGLLAPDVAGIQPNGACAQRAMLARCKKAPGRPGAFEYCRKLSAARQQRTYCPTVGLPRLVHSAIEPA